jgi:hypothetical protein
MIDGQLNSTHERASATPSAPSDSEAERWRAGAFAFASRPGVAESITGNLKSKIVLAEHNVKAEYDRVSPLPDVRVEITQRGVTSRELEPRLGTTSAHCGTSLRLQVWSIMTRG